MTTTAPRKKLIEVSIPLEAINVASAREKSIRHGHPSTLHLWWARRPLAACRAVLFAQLVDDPSSWPDRFPTEEAQDVERRRLHRIIEDMVPWEASKYVPPAGAFMMHASGQTPGHTYMIAGDEGRFIIDNGMPQGRDLRGTSKKILEIMYRHGVFFLPPGINPQAW